ncbi:MAG TPA: hypothetical protein PLP19_10010 [bacterium]|nr:hypothetical protein [bacterium]HPN43812.1 hypothetical protein [bacterium]
MKAYTIILLLLLICSIHCEKSLDPGNADNQMIMQYKFMKGWTGHIITINIYANGVITDTTGTEKEAGFSHAEWRQLNNFLIKFTEIKEQFIPSDGAFCDFDNHWLVKAPASQADTIYIYEGLDSERIPAELRSVVEMLRKKL